MPPQTRHVACNSCRHRKTRCDGNQPCCSQCAARSSPCNYVRPEVQDQQEILGLLRDLSQRLGAFENSITPQHEPKTPDFEHHGAPEPILFSTDEMLLSDLGTTDLTVDENIFMIPESTTDVDHQIILDILDISSPSFSGDIFSDPIMSWNNVSKLAQPKPVDKLVSSDPALQDIYQTYFNKAHSGCFMIDPDVYYARLGEVPETPEVNSLKYALLAQGASVSASYMQYKENFYKVACNYFGQIKTSTRLRSIVALQACVLLAFYELQHVRFENARASLNRAVLMTRMFGLNRMDQHRDSGLATGSTTESELEEQRRTFWTVFNLCCFASITAGWNAHTLIDYNQITTFLPTQLPLGQVVSASQLTLSDVLCPSSSPKPLSTTHGLIVSFAVQGFAFVHIGNSFPGLNSTIGQGDFWLQHYHLCESLGHVLDTFGMDRPSLISNRDSDPLCMFLNLHATKITLHFAANLQIAKCKTTSLPVFIDHETTCLDSAIMITETTVAVCRMDRGKISPYIPWAIYVAAQVFVRDLQRFGISPNPIDLVASHNKAVPGTTGSDTSQHRNLDLIQRLLGTLSILTLHNPIAGLFMAQINLEIMRGKPLTDLRPIGRVENMKPGSDMVQE